MITLIEAYNGMAPGNFGISVNFSGTSDWVMLPSNLDYVSVAIHPTGGTAHVEFTLSGKNWIDANSAQWMTWPLGEVSASANDALLTHASAIRGVATGGTALLEVLAT